MISLNIQQKSIIKFLKLSNKLKIQYLNYYISISFRQVLYFLTGFIPKLNLKIKNVTYGKKLLIIGGIILDIFPESKVIIKDNVSIISDPKRCSASTLYSKTKLKTFSPSSTIIIGEGTGLNGTSITSRSKKITIGKNCMFAPNTIIVDSDFHIPWPPKNRNIYLGCERDNDIIIGDNCWVGMNTIILKGVKIGENSVIGAGSIVNKDIPPNSLAAGNPAKIIKQYIN